METISQNAQNIIELIIDYRVIRKHNKYFRSKKFEKVIDCMHSDIVDFYSYLYGENPDILAIDTYDIDYFEERLNNFNEYISKRKEILNETRNLIKMVRATGLSKSDESFVERIGYATDMFAFYLEDFEKKVNIFSGLFEKVKNEYLKQTSV